MAMMLGRFVMALHILCVGSAMAAPAVRLCLPEVELWPFAYERSSKGSVIDTLQLAARRANLTLQIKTYPTRRCHELVRSGAMDSTLVGYSQENLGLFLFPEDANESSTPASRLVNLQAAVYRRKGSQANWDGEHFSHASSIGIPHDYLVLKQKLSQFPVRVDENNFNAEQQLQKLLASRFDLMITYPEYLEPMLRHTQTSQLKIEKLQQLFLTAQMYLVFSRASGNTPAAAEALWQSIRDLMQSGDAKQLLQRAQQQPRP